MGDSLFFTLSLRFMEGLLLLSVLFCIEGIGLFVGPMLGIPGLWLLLLITE